MGSRQWWRVGRAASTIATALALAVGASACTSGPSLRAPATPQGPDFTSVAEATALPRLDPPARKAGELTRLTVRAGERGSFTGMSLPGGMTVADGRYRLTGRCLSDGSDGVLAVYVVGPGRGGADGAPSQPQPGDPVATASFMCDRPVSSVDLPRLPAGSSEVMVSAGTQSVAVGWVVLSAVS
ncbi:hypothetical protein [Intrasporangium sp. YIM S08009]|uniref:hypothetical protein n=1 Tax=Intrasporangium zincisolvens TaxID=3080018 RepID=UPI002B051BB8|nr:hypothetical protein [Intrasporangium sp. YIM S08009]